MIEPTTATVAAFVAAISAVTLSMLGLEYYALLWGLVGALLAMGHSVPMTRAKAMVFVILSALTGAALGNGLLDILNSTSRPMLILSCLVGGAGAQKLIAALVQVWIARIHRVGDKQ